MSNEKYKKSFFKYVIINRQCVIFGHCKFERRLIWTEYLNNNLHKNKYNFIISYKSHKIKESW